jgi:hypothetical protein
MTTPELITHAVVVLAYAAERWRRWRRLENREFPDSQVFRTMAQLSLLSSRFWAGGRPWAVPLAYKCMGSRDVVLHRNQLWVSVTAWSVLAEVVGSAMTGPGTAALAVLVLLAVSLDDRIVQWDRLVLGESFSLSATALWLAAGIQLYSHPTRELAVGFLCISCLWAACRDTNAWALPVVATALALEGRTCCPVGGAAIWPVLLCGWFFVCLASATHGRRWVTPLLNALLQRVLTVPAATSRLASYGMPMSATLLSRAGTWSWTDDYFVHKEPELLGFRTWFYRQGRRDYARYLLSSIFDLCALPFRHADELLGAGVGGYSSVPRRNRLLHLLHNVLGSRLVVGAALAVGVMGLMLGGGASAATWAVVVLVAGYAQAIVVWCGDAAEVPRHALLTSVQMRVATVIIVLVTAERALAAVF